MRLSKARCFDLMNEALQAPIRLDCGPDVGRVRRRCYRVRQSCQARGNFRFDRLSFVLEGATLVISRRPISAARQLRHKFKLLQEMRAFVAKRGVGL